MNKELRLISQDGRIRMLYCLTDTEGYVEKILLEEYEGRWANMNDFKRFVTEVNAASSKAVVVVNAANKGLLMQSVLDLDGEG